MTEILTESFCERCGTRYTFESARQRVRLESVKVLSRGLKNFVLSDDTSIEEAMAAARSEAEREATAHQLDAFHKTFNFCMSCRQYTCPNCWNESEARCLSCAPLALSEAPVAADGFRVLREAVLIDEPAPGNGGADQEHGTWPALTEVAAEAWSVEPAEIEAEETSPVAGDAAGKATAQTAGLLRRFRPGQNLDAELDAFERERGDAAVTGERAAERATPEAEPEAVAAAQPEPVAAELAASEEPETIEVATVEPQAAPVAEEPAVIEPPAIEPAAPAAPAAEPAIEMPPEPEPEPEPEARPLPAAAGAGADVVDQPTWRITAPDATGTAPRTPPPERDGAIPLQANVTPTELPTPGPHWPASPQWPGAPPAAGLPFLGRPAAPQGGIEALWAASNQELVTAPPAPGRATNGIRPCVSCGLSLSAAARFCRRCGTLQGD